MKLKLKEGEEEMVCYIAFSYEKVSVYKRKYFKQEALESLKT